MPDDDLHERIIDAANATYGSHGGRRALHAKGSWARGTFTAAPEAARLTCAAHLRGEPVEALVRFSNASGDPEAHDADRDGRGMAVKLRFDGGETDILATTSPAFLTRTPEEFLELISLRRPDPATGQPDLEKLGAFLAGHPESQTAVQAVIMSEPLASFATATYFSPHAFALVDAEGTRTWVRYRWHPEAGERRKPDDEARDRGRDYLHDDLGDRLLAGTIGFELRLQLAGADDPLDDPTAVWPDERELLRAGRLELTELIDDPERDGHIDVFDPARIVDGIELSDDPILRARPHAYSVSAYRRLGRA
ncbi:MAG: catalase [Solirubrobacterales bacterium]|nr:catalase [Solirubrobacterales bacterium]